MKQPYNRKQFLQNSFKVASGIALLSSSNSVFASTGNMLQKEYTVQEIMDIMLQEIAGAPFKETVDTLKSGNASQKVTGIVSTMFATIEVIKKAVEHNANFIIAHEPTFYNHTDNKNWVAGNTVVQQKAALLEKHGIAVWRFHDYCHALNPDAIHYGVAKKAGWLSYYKQGETVIELPATNLQALVQHVKKTLGIGHVKVIGDSLQSCKRIALLPGAWGGQRQVSAVLEHKPDVLIVGESAEWETVEFIRDGNLLGHKTALIILGHSVSEEPGMKWVADWLQPKIPGIRVIHIGSKDPFTWM